MKLPDSKFSVHVHYQQTPALTKTVTSKQITITTPPTGGRCKSCASDIVGEYFSYILYMKITATETGEKPIINFYKSPIRFCSMGCVKYMFDKGLTQLSPSEIDFILSATCQFHSIVYPGKSWISSRDPSLLIHNGGIMNYNEWISQEGTNYVKTTSVQVIPVDGSLSIIW